MEAGGPAVRLYLPRLGRADLEGLLHGLIGHPPDDAMVEAVLARSEGNPFLAEELVAADAVSGVLPEGLRNLLLARTLGLPEAARQVVGLAAAAGAVVDDDLLQQAWLAAYGQTSALAGALRRAVAAGVLAVVAGQRHYAFRHALVREAVYDDLLPGDRSRWHRELARCLSRAPGGDQGTGYAAQAALVAHHWQAAGDRVRALAASIDAGQAAEQTLAFGEAARHYQQAAGLWPELGADAAGASPWTLSQLFQHAAFMSYLSGDPHRAVAEASRAIDLADAGRERTRVGLMHERRGRYRWRDGHPYADVLRDFGAAVELVPDEPTSARARVLAAMGQGLMLGHRFGEAIEVTERALAVARAAGAPPEIVAHALSTLGVSRAYSGDVAGGIKLAEEAVQVAAAQAPHTEDLHRAYGNLSCVLMLEDLRRSARQQAQAELSAALEAADRMGACALAEEARLLAMRARVGSPAAGAPAPYDRFGLTQREHDVLGLVCAGRTNRQIAAELFITPKTAGLHVSHILAKLSVTTRGEAAALAHRLGFAAAASDVLPPGTPDR